MMMNNKISFYLHVYLNTFDITVKKTPDVLEYVNTSKCVFCFVFLSDFPKSMSKMMKLLLWLVIKIVQHIKVKKNF